MASELPEIVGFFSYSRRDDEHSMGALSRLRARIQSELRLQMGRDFRLWQDTAAIPDGSLWEDEIRKAIAESVFFVPIVTPSAVSSGHCSFEFEAFVKREAELGRSDLIFPILYITVEELEDEKQWRQSELLRTIGTRQYLDWRKYRHHDPSAPEVAQQIEQYCRHIYRALRRPVVTAEERRREEGEADARRRAEEQRRRKEVADAQKRIKDEERRKKAETEARARAEEERRQSDAEAKQRSEQERAFATAKRAGTVDAVNKFIFDHPQSHRWDDAHRLRAQLIVQVQEKAFALAKRADTVAAIDNFLADYPEGQSADAAHALRAKLIARDQETAFAAAKRADTVSAIDGFLAGYPQSHRVADAEALRAKLMAREHEKAFAAAKRVDTLGAIDGFLADHPQSHLAGAAQVLRDKLSARAAAQRSPAGGSAAASDTLRDGPHGRFRALAPGGWRSPLAVALLGGVLVVVAGGVWLMSQRGQVPPSSADGVPLTLAQEQALKPKDRFKECATCPTMVVVPAGSFTMGSPDNEPGRNSDEQQVRVAIPHSFAIGEFAVTFDQWDACKADGGCNDYAPADAGWGRGQRPAINVSWKDAEAYIAWLSRQTGKTYRLASEAEREFVTRAGSVTPFWWGSSIAPTQANYNATYVYQGGAKGTYRAQTVPVDSFAPNPWGLYQVHGNVWEWTDDCWNDSNSGNPGDGTARRNGDCDRRVVRGGAWFNSPGILRSASRGNYPVENRSEGFGFRVARTLGP